jgi:hypothetical protein
MRELALALPRPQAEVGIKCAVPFAKRGEWGAPAG